jgi:hypothetical protein
MTRARVTGPILMSPTSVNGLTETIIPDLQAASRVVQSNLNTETANRIQAITDVTLALGSEASTARTNEAALGVRIDDVIAANSVEHTERLSAETALGLRIDNVIANTDPTAIDSLVEVVTFFHDADSNMQTAIINLGQAAGTGLSDEIAARGVSEAALGVRIDTVITDTTANLSQAVAELKVYADNSATLAGADDIIEDLTVTADSITLAHKPKNGWASIIGGQVEYINGAISYKLEVSADATVASGKVYKLHVTPGSYNGKQVRIQYSYISTQ